MQIIRGTTPTITAHVRSNINLNNVSAWVYIYQQGEIIVDRTVVGDGSGEIQIDPTEKTIKIKLTQAETLRLKADVGAIYQIRLKRGSTAYASLAANIAIKEIYKGGTI